MKKRYLATAVPVLLAGALAAATPGLSQAAGDRVPDRGVPKATGAKALAATTPCAGGVQKRGWTGGYAGWVSTTTSTTVPGTLFQFQGPATKKDTVFVSLTAPETYTTPGDSTRIRVLLDGVDMSPAAAAAEYVFNDDNYRSFAGQYCARVGTGPHEVRLVIESSGTDNASYLFNPMLHVEVAE